MKKALLQMHLAVLLWGFTGVLGRAITLDAPVLVWYRMLLTVVIIWVMLVFRCGWARITLGDFWRMALVGGLMALHWVAFYGAIQFSNASIAMVCLSTASVFATLFHVVINRVRYQPSELLLGMLALLGMGLIYGVQTGFGLGILLGVVAAILSALFTVLNKRIAHKYPSRVMVFYEMGTGWLLLSLLMPFQFLVRPETRMLPGMFDWLWLLLLSLCCTVWAQSLALNALKQISSFTATLSVNLEPVYGIVLAFIFFRENRDLHWGFFVGVGLILMSVMLQMVLLMKPKWANRR